MSQWTICDCGQRMRTAWLQTHKAERCKGSAHCSFCARPRIREIFERLRAGEHPDLVAKALDLTIEYVQESRGRGRALVCLPRPTPEEVAAERAQTALLRHGTRTCSECPTEFVPRLNAPEQATCGNSKCQARRHYRMAAERKADPVVEEVEAVEVVPEEKAVREMNARARQDAELAAEAEAQGWRILATRERQHALWLECLGVVA